MLCAILLFVFVVPSLTAAAYKPNGFYLAGESPLDEVKNSTVELKDILKTEDIAGILATLSKVTSDEGKRTKPDIQPQLANLKNLRHRRDLDSMKTVFNIADDAEFSDEQEKDHFSKVMENETNEVKAIKEEIRRKVMLDLAKKMFPQSPNDQKFTVKLLEGFTPDRMYHTAKRWGVIATEESDEKPADHQHTDHQPAQNLDYELSYDTSSENKKETGESKIESENSSNQNSAEVQTNIPSTTELNDDVTLDALRKNEAKQTIAKRHRRSSDRSAGRAEEEMRERREQLLKDEGVEWPTKHTELESDYERHAKSKERSYPHRHAEAQHKIRDRLSEDRNGKEHHYNKREKHQGFLYDDDEREEQYKPRASHRRPHSWSKQRKVHHDNDWRDDVIDDHEREDELEYEDDGFFENE